MLQFQVQQCALECDAKGLDHLFSAIVTSAIATGDQLNPLAAEDVKPLRQHRLTVVETAIQVCVQCVFWNQRVQDHQDVSGSNCSMQHFTFLYLVCNCTEDQACSESLHCTAGWMQRNSDPRHGCTAACAVHLQGVGLLLVRGGRCVRTSSSEARSRHSGGRHDQHANSCCCDQGMHCCHAALFPMHL